MGMGMGIAAWEWEGMGIKNPFPNTSTLQRFLDFIGSKVDRSLSSWSLNFCLSISRQQYLLNDDCLEDHGDERVEFTVPLET